jgi:hypothetical protein
MTFQSAIAAPSLRPAHQRLGIAAGAALLCSLAVVACGGASTSSSAATSAAAGTATPTAAVSAPAATATPASGTTTLSCPTASEVGAALGLTVPAPTTIGTSASGVACNYLSETPPVLDVEVSIVHGISTSYLTTAEASQQAIAAGIGFSFTSVSGVGDEAYTYSYNITSGTALGIIAVKGTTFVGIACTMTTTTLAKVEAYANQLLG